MTLIDYINSNKIHSYHQFQIKIPIKILIHLTKIFKINFIFTLLKLLLS